mmetsp:Transcript_46196/g.100381  ORF Transcript_46196/g.100381 Transcript_46196/m.100381 type:complete len:232 (+) Transcript_46196:417-1112(+)
MIDQDPTFRVLRADGASQGILIPTIPASWRVTPTKDAAVFAQARLPGLQLPPLLYASLPHVVTDVAEMGGAEAEVVRLALAAVAALPAQELGAMLRTLELPLRGASPAHEFHRKSGLHVFVQVLLFFLLHACTLHLAAIVRLVALRAFEERHSGHRQSGDFVLVTRIVCSRRRPPLLHDPALQSLSSHLLVHVELRRHQGVYRGVLYDSLAERAPDALEGEPSACCVALPH